MSRRPLPPVPGDPQIGQALAAAKDGPKALAEAVAPLLAPESTTSLLELAGRLLALAMPAHRRRAFVAELPDGGLPALFAVADEPLRTDLLTTAMTRPGARAQLAAAFADSPDDPLLPAQLRGSVVEKLLAQPDGRLPLLAAASRLAQELSPDERHDLVRRLKDPVARELLGQGGPALAACLRDSVRAAFDQLPRTDEAPAIPGAAAGHALSRGAGAFLREARQVLSGLRREFPDRIDWLVQRYPSLGEKEE